MPLHTRLKELRLQNNLSQERLAIKLNIATRTYIYYETGKKFPSVKLLTRMAEFFDVSISFLMGEQGEYIAQDQEITNDKFGVKQLVEEISCLFSGSKLSEIEKYALMKELYEACEKVKKKNDSVQPL